MKKHILFAALILSGISFPAMAQISYETPEYSGPNARIEHGMNRNGNPQPGRSGPGALRYNDRAYEAESATRHDKITREMDMRRDETIRANQSYILRTNE